jgi:tetratricopeptide (TPR) repeat protein
VLAVRRKAQGEEHPSFATTLNNMAGVYDDQGRHEEALEMYRRVLEVRRKALGEEHPSFATTLHNMAMVYRGQGRYDEALEMYRMVRAGGATQGDALLAAHRTLTTTCNANPIVPRE